MKDVIEHYNKLFILKANLYLSDEFETKHAYVIVCPKASPCVKGGGTACRDGGIVNAEKA